MKPPTTYLLLSIIIIPHGITDIMVSYEYNLIPHMITSYIIIPYTLYNIDYSLYKLLFISLSFIHFYGYTLFIPVKIIMNYYSGIYTYDKSLIYIIHYLAYIHTPLHYYEILSNTNYIYEHLCIINFMILLSILITPYLLKGMYDNNGNTTKNKLLGTIIMSHIFFNEIFLMN